MQSAVIILGTRGSAPVSGPSYQKYGCATTCFLLRLGGRSVLVDAGTGLMNLPEAELSAPSLPLLLTHAHADHLPGLPLCPYVMRSGRRLDIYAARHDGLDGREQILRFMSPPLWPVTPDHLSAEIRFHDLPASLDLYGGSGGTVEPEERRSASTPEGTGEASTPEGTGDASTPEGTGDASTPEERRSASTPEGTGEAPTPEGTGEASTPEGTGEAGVIHVDSMEGVHPGGVSLLRVSGGGRSVAVMTDCTLTEELLPRAAAFARDCDLLLCDGQYSPAEWSRFSGFGHSTWTDAARLGQLCGAARVLVVHHAPGRTDGELDRAERELHEIHPRCAFAREGEEVIL